MIGRRVKTVWGEVGVVAQWDPLSAALVDVLVVTDDNKQCWHASHSLQPIDGLGPFQTRQEARALAKAKTLLQLRAIRDAHFAEVRSHKPWPGMEFAKVHVAQMINGAITDLETE